ncbi:MAG: nucleoside monophosphate kinase [archaeon]
MNLIFVGPQGSGKGTQAKMIAKKFGFCHISTGDLLRGVTGYLKSEVDRVMSEGRLVGDELIVKILKEKLSGEECEEGFILDGFPRNVAQADMLRGISEIDKVVEISISDEESVRRVCGRRNCVKCGEIFNVYSKKPLAEGVCDECGGELVQRKDDNEEALRERLKVYHEETEKILKMYTSVKINGEQSIEKVFGEIVEILS